MIPIYICDDNEKEKNHLNGLVENQILIQEYDMRVVLASTTPEEILAHRQSHVNRSVYILDVNLNHETQNGFTLAKKLRELDSRGFIVFVTTNEEMMYETFRHRLEAMDYLIKDEPQRLSEKLGECLSEIVKLVDGEKNDRQGYYTVKTSGCVFHIPIEEILYFKTAGDNHRVVLHAKDRMLEFRGDLNKLEKDMDSGFMRIHRSYLIKADKIDRVDYNAGSIVMEDGSVCAFSRKGKNLLKDYFK